MTDDQARITELTEEYKIVSDNMKSLEASEAVVCDFVLERLRLSVLNISLAIRFDTSDSQ